MLIKKIIKSCMNNKLNEIIEILKTLTLLETGQLITEIKEIFNINIDSNISLDKENSENQDIMLDDSNNKKVLFNVTLTEIPIDKKIAVLKIVRTITGLGLKESKDIVDNIPKLLKENIKKEDADKIKSELEAVGAKVQVL
jgi:large subunit ribosomal protein L7/L12